MNAVKIILVFALTLYLVVVTAAYLLQRKLLYFPPNVYLTPEAVGLPDMQEIEIRTSETNWSTAWWHPPSRPDADIVMVFHGNGSAVYSHYDMFADLIAAGHGVWSVGYPGYPGLAPGRSGISQTAIVKSARTQRLMLDELNTNNAPINYYGTSLGAGIAVQLAQDHPPKRLFLDAPFYSALDMGRMRMKFLPVRWLMKDQYRSDLAIQAIDVPLYWTHGTADRVIPTAEGQRLYDAYQGPKQHRIFKGGHHTNLWALGGREIVLDALRPRDIQESLID